jgi:hypothetical protein
MKEVENESRKMGLDILNKLNTVDSGVVHTTGNETIAGTKTFTSSIVGNVTGDVSGTATNAINLTGSGTVSATTTGGAGLTPTNATNSTNATRLTGNFLNTSGSNVASASTISTTGSVFHVTGTTEINTINIPYTGFTGSITIIPDAEFTFGTSGNIGGGQTYCAIANKPIVLTYDGTKWWPVASQDSGSNGNGKYIRYSDGTMMCWYDGLASQTTTNASGILWYNNATVTFPVPFISAPVVNSTNRSQGSFIPWSGFNDSITTTTARLWLIGGGATWIGALSYTAIGKWK